MGEPTLFCNRCGAGNSAAARFFVNCGTPFSSDLQPAASVPAAQVSVQPQAPAWQAASPAWQPVPAGYAGPASHVRYGGFWLRFVAALIDGILVSVVMLPVRLVVGLSSVVAGHAADMPEIGVHVVRIIISGTIGLLCGWIYEAAMESSSKQATLGKMALNLKVTDMEGRRISFARASGRHFAKFISAMILLVGYIMAGFTLRKQALHDMIAGTLVQRTQ
jgi:uncharacterized RDD family membrane protein YckC